MSNEMFVFILFIFCGQLHLSKEKLYRLASKTHYDMSLEIDRQDKFVTPLQLGDDILFSDKCLHMYGNFRHGSRYPGKKDVEHGLAIMKKLKDLGFPDGKYQMMNAVIQDMDGTEKSKLSPSGMNEHRDIGKTYGQIFKKLKIGKVTPNNIVFGHTFKSRANESMLGFMETFLEIVDPKSNKDAYQGVQRDDLLRFFEHCSEYTKTVKENEATKVEKKKFMDHNRELLLGFIKPLVGLPNLDLSNAELDAWQTIAGIELAINRTLNWIQYLNDSSLEIMEYASDLSTYWLKGPGVKINYAMSCGVIKEIFGIYDDILAGRSKEIARFYFSHAETLIPLLNIIGLFRGDKPLKHDNFESNKNREFKVTRVSPFATNFVFVLFQRGKKLDVNGAYIRLYFKGEPYRFSFCKSSVCQYSKVKEYLQEYITNCDFTTDCRYIPVGHLKFCPKYIGKLDLYLQYHSDSFKK